MPEDDMVEMIDRYVSRTLRFVDRVSNGLGMNCQNAYVPCMKIRLVATSRGLVLAGLAFCHSAFADDEVREWRSTNGKSVRGELIEVRDGKAIIRPETRLIEAPLIKLAETDREIAIAWGKKQERIQADRAAADLLLAKSKPLGKALIGSTLIAKGKSLVPYELKNISKIEYVLLYLILPTTTGDVDNLNRLYKRLKNRYDNFEFIALASAKTTEEATALFIEAEIEFPVVLPNRLNGEGAQPLSQLYSRNVAPQIAVIDADGRIVSDSYRAQNPDDKKRGKEGEWTGPKQEMKQPLSDLQKLLRGASKGTGEDSDE